MNGAVVRGADALLDAAPQAHAPTDRAEPVPVAWLIGALVLMVLPLPFLASDQYLGSADLHSAMEVIGGPIGLVAGLVFVRRALALGERAHLFFGLAFLVNASADILHGLLPFLVERDVLALSASAMEEYLPLSFLVGRVTAAFILVAGPWLVRQSDAPFTRRQARRLTVAMLALGAVLATVLFVVPLPTAVYPERIIGRPADALSALLFIPATITTYRYHRRTGDPMAWWVAIFALAGVVSQAYMGLSDQLFDAHFDTAHLYKAISYLLPLLGLSVHQVRLIAERDTYAAQLEERADVLVLANEQLERANAVKTEFVSVVSHELRTPLTAILGFASTMAEFWDETPDDEKREHLGIIERQGLRLSRLINDLLAMSQLESGTLETFIEEVDVSRALHRYVDDLGDGSVAEHLTIEVEDGLLAKADPDHLEQIVLNFLTNADRYGAPPVILRAWCEDDAVIISVEDGGPGVPEAFREHLFDKFAQASTGATRRSQGTGLGLAIVRGLARAQGGEAWFEPNEPTGSRFLVRLSAAGHATRGETT